MLDLILILIVLVAAIAILWCPLGTALVMTAISMWLLGLLVRYILKRFMGDTHVR
jgi:small-conductance mechanosensitive channel